MTGCKPADLAGAKAGEERHFDIGHGVNLEFRWVPAGEFPMGRSNAANQTLVRIEDGFWIAAGEMTALDWQTVTGGKPALSDDSPPQPLARVSWDDCRNFLKRLESPDAGWHYELPTEAQWEYARRAGSKACAKQTGRPDINSGKRSHPKEAQKPNAWSIRDMHENAAEWRHDSVKTDEPDIAGNRAAARGSDLPFLRVSRIGFRLALVRTRSGGTTAVVQPACKIDPPAQP